MDNDKGIWVNLGVLALHNETGFPEQERGSFILYGTHSRIILMKCTKILWNYNILVTKIMKTTRKNYTRGWPRAHYVKYVT